MWDNAGVWDNIAGIMHNTYNEEEMTKADKNIEIHQWLFDS